MPDREEDAPKIIVDSDWKSQAQAEKERLAEQEAEREKDAASRPGAGGPGDLPPPDFGSLVGMLATQAVMYMGTMADKNTGAAIFDPEYAKHMIDLLGMLEEKTRGNLTEDEARDLGQILHELRTRFVDLARAVAQGGGQAPGSAGAPPTPGRPPAPGA